MTQQSGAGSPQQFCLRWNNYQTNLTNVFDQLLQSESFVDVTLACDGHSVKAHKMVLSACSPYFQALFFDNPCQHPIVIMKDIKWPELKAAVEFMYKGEINVSQEQIGPLLKVAESLKIRGLADVNSEHELASRAGLDESLNLAGGGGGAGGSGQQQQQQQQQQSASQLMQQAGQRKKRRLASSSAERSPSAGGLSPERASDRDEQDSASTGHESHGLGSSSTPRSLGSPCSGMPSISVTPQINLQELPVNLPLPPPPPPPGQQQSAQQQQQQQSSPHPSLLGHHVSPGHVSATGGSHASVNHLSAHAVAQQLSVQQQQQQQQQQQLQAGVPLVGDDLEIKPGIAEMIREEERAKLLESSHAWLGASTSSIAADYSSLLKLKAPTWTRQELKEAIEAVVTQKMRFTQASSKYGIPKGTLYDNILGKSKRMMVLEEAGLELAEETAVLEFCCDISVSPYNRRTKKSLQAILGFVEKLRRQREPAFAFTGLSGFRWWWAFCKKHGIVSLYFNDENDNDH